MSEYSQYIGPATESALKAGALIKSQLGTLSASDIASKQAADFVTRVDKDSEALIIKTISGAYPDHVFLAEESARDEGEFRWIIDPLDGTTNFIHSYPMFSVSIALEHRGELVAGVVYDPSRDELFHASKGAGAYCGGSRLSVTSHDGLNPSCIIATGFPFKKREHLDRYLQAFKAILLKSGDLRRAGSAALDFANVAAGRLDGFFEIGLGPWDMAAGTVLIREAGGVVSDFSGGDAQLSTGNVVAGGPGVHAALLAEVQAVFSGTIDR